MSIELELYKDELDLDEREQDEHHMSTLEHSAIASTINREIGIFLKGKNVGRVFDSSAEYRFLLKLEGTRRKPARQPDVSFVRQERLPQRLRSYPDIAPDLVVEIESPNDPPYQTLAKIKDYQQAGVKLVWLVRPYSRVVEIFRLINGLVPQSVGTEAELSGEEVLPGFKLAVSEIFDFPTDPDPDPDTDK